MTDCRDLIYNKMREVSPYLPPSETVTEFTIHESIHEPPVITMTVRLNWKAEP